MRKSYLIATAVGLLLALGGAAQAGPHGLGVGGPPAAPPGLPGTNTVSQGQHNGFNGSNDPPGWSQEGKDQQGAANLWKDQSNPPMPPGLSNH